MLINITIKNVFENLMWEVIKMQSKLAFQNPVNYYYRKNLLTFNTMGHCACVHFGTKEVFLIWKQRKGVYVILSVSEKKIINTCYFNLPVCFQNWEYTSTDSENQLDLPKLKWQFYCYIKQVLFNDFFFLYRISIGTIAGRRVGVGSN